MKATVYYEQNAPLRIEEIQIDRPKQGEVLVKIAATGVCHSDLSVINGNLPFPPPPTVLGHEGAGIVEEVSKRCHLRSAGRSCHPFLATVLQTLRLLCDRPAPTVSNRRIWRS
jgi:D-arabinose 1-dehydrogenase-like Zn-dependent alcohol dehydrogenase